MNKKVTSYILLVCMLFFLFSCSKSPTDKSNDDNSFSEITVIESSSQRDLTPDYSKGDLEELVAGNTEFALNLYAKLAQEDGNLFISPYSISIALAMTFAGARNETETQIKNTLCFPFSQEKLHPTFNALDLALTTNTGESTLTIINALWGQTRFPFLLKYLDVLAVNYGAGMNLLDFYNKPEESRIIINNWVSEQTEEKIQDLLPPGAISSLTRLVLTNAIYFYSQWHYCFDEELTKDSDFYLLDSNKVTVPIMAMVENDSAVEVNYNYAPKRYCRAVELLYKGERLSMILLVPHMGEFKEFESSLNYEILRSIIDSLQPAEKNVQLPKFTFTSNSIKLKTVLSDMSMPIAFIPNVADFSGIDGTTNLFIGDVIHKAFISVDENGTEAAGATAVDIMVIGPGHILNINRPFIFLIRDRETETILFIGRILNPNG